MFADTITMWISGLFRPLAFDFENESLEGTNDDGKLWEQLQIMDKVYEK